MLSIAALFMMGFICCNHHKSYIDVEKVIDSASNEALKDTVKVDSMIVDTMVVNSLHVDSVVVK